MRLAPDKALGTILLPVLVQPDDDVEMTLQTSEFRNVWAVVNALRAHDDELAEEIDEARRNLGRTGITGGRPA
jgi:predicted helicase